MANDLHSSIAIAWTIAISACAPARSFNTPPSRIEGTSSTGLHYVVEGAGPPVVLVHAFQMDAREWDEVAPRLAKSWRVIRYDVRGHGRSPMPPRPMSAHDDLRDLLDELKVPRASLVGLSMGGGIALDATLAYPERVDRLVMISSTVPGVTTVIPFDWMTPIIAAVRAGAKDSAAALWWASSMMARTRARGADGERYHRVVLDNARIWGENPASRLPLDPPAGKRLESLTAPLLVIVGEHDVAGIRQLADTVTRRARNARALTMAGAGHMISTERPAELATAIAEFLSSSKPRR